MCFPPQASLERIGVDSKGTVYWYDGGKNMFQSPPSNDPAYKPRYVRVHALRFATAMLYMCAPCVNVLLILISSLSLSLLLPFSLTLSLSLPMHSESELQLSCKSMVQWTAKLK